MKHSRFHLGKGLPSQKVLKFCYDTATPKHRAKVVVAKGYTTTTSEPLILTFQKYDSFTL